MESAFRLSELALVSEGLVCEEFRRRGVDRVRSRVDQIRSLELSHSLSLVI